MSAETKNEKKSKFNFVCTKCGECCLNRGPIPLVLSDLERWASNNVVSKFLPYIKFFRTPNGGLDIVLSKIDSLERLKEKDVDKSCPFYDKKTKLCLEYENRPLSCRTYPLEFDGNHFQLADSECEGLNNGEMTKEERIAMRDTAKQMYSELRQMRIAMPIFYQAIQPFIIQELVKAQEEYMKAMEKMSPEERAKFEEEMKRNNK